MCKKLIFLVSIVSLLVALPATAHAQAVNLVLNPSFEEDEAVLDDPAWEQWATWNPAEGAGSNATIVDTDAADGARSLRIEPVGVENWHFIVLYLPIMVDMEKDYTASFWAKAEGPRPLTVQMKATDNSINAWGATDFELTTDWAEYSYTSEVLIDNVKVEILCAGSEVPFLLDQVSVFEADTLSGLGDVTVVDGAIVSIRDEGTEYVVADGDLILGTTTRWYVLDGVETLWAEGDPAPAATVSGTSDPKDGDVGSKADNFLFTLNGSTNISSIDGIDFQETIFPSLVDTIIVFERNGNDVGTMQAIYADGSLGAAVAFVKASDGGPYADTGIDVNGQNAYGVVFRTSVPVQGVRITASGHDTLSISAVVPVEPPATITVEAGGDIAAANELAKAGDTIEIAAGTYYLTSQIEIKDGVTYRGAGAGLTIIDGNDVTRAFVAWGDRSFNEGNENPNDSGPKGWVLEGMTIQNCVADTHDRFSYAGAAFDLLDGFADNDADGSGGLSPDEADADAGAIRLGGADATEGTEDDDLHRFAAMDADGNGELSEAELNAQLLSTEVEFGNESGDGGAIFIGNQAAGTIQNCDFLNNHTPIAGDGDDGGAINITGLSVVTINDCLFNGNYACSATSVEELDETGDADGDGGHIKVQGPSASAITPGTTLIANRCIFLNGNAEDDGGAIQSSAVGTVVRLDSCWFEGNTSWDNGNVCQFSNNAQNEVTVTNCIFVNNITKADNSPDRMIETNRNSKFINCTFVGNIQEDQDLIYNNANTQDTNGDGVDDETADITQVVNCLFVNNVVGNGDDVLGSRDDNFTIAATNCLFFGNTLQNGNDADNTQRPDVETGSIMSDPLLDADLVPMEGSEAIDGGVDPAIVGVTLTNDYNGRGRPKGAAYDIGAFEVGIDNLLANGGFEDGVVEPWSTYGDVTTEVVTELTDAAVPEAPIEGSCCLHVTVPGPGANFWDAGLQHAGHVFEAGKQYTLSVYMKSKSGTLDINLKPERAVSPWEGYGDQIVTITEEWAEYSVTTPVLEADVDPASITFHIAFAAGDFWVDGASWTVVE